MTARLMPDTHSAREQAARVLAAGGIVAIPTDTVYGLTAGLRVRGAIERLFVAKRRPAARAIALLLGSPEQAAEVAIVGAAARALAAAFWPGGLTLVLAARPEAALPAALTGGSATVGVRLPDHPCPRDIASLEGPLPATSANLSGRPEARRADEILALFGHAVDLVLDGGPAPGGAPSTVVDCSTERPRILRAGAIPPSRLAAALDAAGIGHDLR